MRRLALLLTTCTLVACPGDDGTSEETGASASDTTSGETEAPATDTGDPPATGDPPDTTTGDDTDPPGDSSSSGGGVDPAEACTVACEHLVKCGVEDIPTCGIPCSNIAMMIAGCESEYVAQQECVAGLTCEEAQQWSDATMPKGDHPCSEQDVAYQSCIGGG